MKISTVEQCLQTQRKSLNFSPLKLSQFLYNGPQKSRQLLKTLNSLTPPQLNPNIFNKSRQNIIKQSIHDFIFLFNQLNNKVQFNDEQSIYMLLSNLIVIPGAVHTAMFIKCILFMGTEEQEKEYLSKCRTFQIVGSYVQTEIAHGSDVRSLMTKAIYNAEKQQFIIDNSYDLNATKFWPGDLGLYATHALVFAQLECQGKNYGVQSFIVPIRDMQTMKPLPGVQVGDIGPKIGYATRDNGYLRLTKVVIPRKNILGKYIQVQKSGKVTKRGDPRVAYATMMQVRQLISCVAPKSYAQAIIIATKYSIFRKQFKDDNNKQIPIINYQLQQQKILSRIAQYFAVILAGNKISKLSTLNTKLVLQKSDFSLMEEAHACLSIGKPFFSQIVFQGMEICRKACGGHGFSHYSGFPILISNYAPNLTHQGQNTVLYLQVGRYILKNYQRVAMKSQQKLSESVKYLQNYNQLLRRRSTVTKIQDWTLQQVRVLLAQGVCYLISTISQKMVQKQQNESMTDLRNYRMGINIKDMAIMHSAYYTYNSLKQAVQKQQDPKIHKITQLLCLLYGINFILQKGTSIIQGQFLSKQQIKSLKQLKQQILSKLRPDIIGIIDGFGIPDKYVKSALTTGNPYQNYLKLARECQLNKERLESVDIVKSVKNVIRVNSDIISKL